MFVEMVHVLAGSGRGVTLTPDTCAFKKNRSAESGDTRLTSDSTVDCNISRTDHGEQSMSSKQPVAE